MVFGRDDVRTGFRSTAGRRRGCSNSCVTRSGGATTVTAPSRRTCTGSSVTSAFTKWTMASLLYGAGLRLRECLKLRIKDVDFGYRQVTVDR